VIPREAADAIIQHCNLDMLDTSRIREAMRTTEHSLMPLIDEIARVCGEVSALVDPPASDSGER
jgi:adenylosuccinate lyase